MEATPSEAVVYDIDQRSGQPYPAWSRYRSNCPVARAVNINGYSDRPQYHVTTWADVETVLRDWETFSASINLEQAGQFMGEFMLGLDGKEHRSYRNLAAGAFRASQLEQWGDDLIRPTITQLLDVIAPRGSADLVAEVTSQYPVQVICGIVGVPLADVAQFQSWSEDITAGSIDAEKGLASSRAMREYLKPIMDDRREHPNGDLISDLVHAEIDGHKLTDEKIYGFLQLLLPAGAETTFRAMGNALVALLTIPGLLDRVRADRQMLPAVIEETLRWETSVTQVVRVSTRDTELNGCPIPAGSAISVFNGSANHDETRFSDPEIFDVDRPPQNHVAFGTGHHQCLGMHLARLELRVGLEAIIDRLGHLRLDPDWAAPVIQGFSFRGPEALHVLFDPQGDQAL
jgi:cytochrome P450